MLKKRIVTALAMFLCFVSAIYFLPASTLALAFAVVAAAGAWEWGYLAGWDTPIRRALFVAVFLCMCGAYAVAYRPDTAPSAMIIQPVLGFVCLVWLINALLVDNYPSMARLWRSRFTRSLMGLFILGSGWFSLVYVVSLPQGPLLIVLFIITVAAADVGAFFTGRSFGKHKLAEKVSPAKTWEGLYGGLLFVCVLALIVWNFLPPAFAHIHHMEALFIGAACAGASVLGDLTVSMVKRESGYKDSGVLLPGHGGILDRLDSICGAAPFFALSMVLVVYS